MSSSVHSLLDEYERLCDFESEPDVVRFIDERSPLAISMLAQILLLDQARGWQRGKRKFAEDYFRQFPQVKESSEFAVDLLFSEFLFREKSEPGLTVEQVAKDSPEYLNELRKQVDFHRAIESSLTEDSSADSTAAPSGDTSFAIDAIQPHSVQGYEILKELGRGGLGVVYLARDVQLNRKVALKMLLAGKFASEGVLRRLVMEGEATARLQHPNIVQIYEVGQFEGHPYLSLEYVNGGTLAQRLEKGPQPPRDAARLICEIAWTIQFAHENGIVHRDLKPSNILIQDLAKAFKSDPSLKEMEKHRESNPIRVFHRDVQIKIADFGLAKFVEDQANADPSARTMTGDVLGTATYMSPEQAQGKSGLLTASTDIYSLGAILYELLTGRPPFVGVHPLEVLSQVITNDPVPPSQLVRHIPKDLQTICLKCLEKNPNRRYRTAAELAEDLERFLSDRPIVARHALWLERGWRWCRRNPVKVAIASLGTLVLVLMASLSLLYSSMLSSQLALITDAKNNERTLRLNATRQLWEANLARADALQKSRQVGQRFESLKAIDEARELVGSIDIQETQVDRMRNATIAALVLPDLALSQRLKIDWSKDHPFLVISESQEVFAYRQNDGEVVIGRIQDGVVLARIPTNLPLRSLVLCPDGSKIAVISKVCQVYQLPLQSNQESEPFLIFESPSGGPWTFSPDGSQCIGHEKGGVLKRFDLNTEESERSSHTIGKFSRTKQLSISPDGRKVALWVDDSIQVIDVESGVRLARFAPPALPQDFGQTAFSWHPNSRVLAIGPYPEGVVTWDAETGEKLAIFPKSNGAVSFTFDRSGDRLLTYDSWNFELILWNTHSMEQEFQLKGLRLYSLGRKTENSFSAYGVNDQGWVDRFEITLPTIYRTLPVVRSAYATSTTADLSYSIDGRFIAVANRGMVDLFDAHTFGLLGQVFTGSCFVRFDSDGSLLSIVDDGIIRWTVSTRQYDDGEVQGERIVFGPPQHLSNVLSNCPFDVDKVSGAFAVSEGDGAVVWTKESSTPIRTQEPHLDVRRVSIDGHGNRFATSGWHGGDVCIWELHSGKLLKKIRRAEACLVQFSPDGKWLVVSEKEVAVFDTESWTEIYKFNVPGESGSGVRPCFSSDSQSLACSDSNGDIHLLDSASGREFAVLRSPTQKPLMLMQFSPDGTQLATSTGEGIVQVWRLDRLQEELERRELAWRAPSDRIISRSPSEQDPVNQGRLEALFVVDQSFQEREVFERIRRANVAALKSDYIQAQISIDRAIQLDSKQPLACNNLAWLLASGATPIRNPQQAVLLARRAVADPANSPSDRAVFSNTLGLALYRSGAFDEAIAALKLSLETGPPENHPYDYYFLSMSKARLGDRLGAEADFQRAEESVKKLKSVMIFDQQRELEEFSKEAKSVLLMPD